METNTLTLQRAVPPMFVNLQICKTNDAFSSARLTRPGRKSELAACFPPLSLALFGFLYRPVCIAFGLLGSRSCGALSAGLLQLFNPAISRFFQFLVSTSFREKPRPLERETGFQREFFFFVRLELQSPLQVFEF